MGKAMLIYCLYGLKVNGRLAIINQGLAVADRACLDLATLLYYASLPLARTLFLGATFFFSVFSDSSAIRAGLCIYKRYWPTNTLDLLAA